MRKISLKYIQNKNIFYRIKKKFYYQIYFKLTYMLGIYVTKKEKKIDTKIKQTILVIRLFE